MACLINAYKETSKKLRIYQTLVLFVLLYASEIWALLASDTKESGIFPREMLEAHSWDPMA